MKVFFYFFINNIYSFPEEALHGFPSSSLEFLNGGWCQPLVTRATGNPMELPTK